MPLLAIIYAIFLSFILIATFYDKLKRKEPAWYILVNSVCDLIILWLFIAYWKPEIARSTGPVALAAFLSAIVWDLRHLPSNLSGVSDSDVSPEMNHYYRFVLGLCLVLSFPAFWFSGIAAWRCL